MPNPLTAGSIPEVACLSRPNALDPGLCGRLSSSFLRACSLWSLLRPGPKTSRAPRVQGTRGSGPVAWTGERHGDRTCQRRRCSSHRTPRVRAPIMSSPPEAHGHGQDTPDGWRALSPLIPLLSSGAPPGAAARSEAVVLAAQKYYVKGSEGLVAHRVKKLTQAVRGSTDLPTRRSA